MAGTCLGRSHIWWPVILLSLLSAGGCALFQDEEPGTRSDFAKWGEKNRPIQAGSGYGGISSEAQQIERNLGIR